MLKPNGKPSKPEISADLKALEQRVKSAQARNNKSDTEYEDDGALLGMAWRLSTELVVAVLVGAGLGYGLDKLLGTAPWILIIGLGFGFVAGIKTTLRTAAKMDAAAGDVPLGDDLPGDDDDD
jgi:ATP synthase protein I